ncbi:preprotein translocase subunit SecG [Bartonella raoultii]|uniref:Protein-export membrane protein SecG n=1 Tax=Bartonella raoultii TaxID=1457020 RepID=A0ABS7I7M6_9HYPH|nr:preprotein translocase subunit SecG [Bartonella raoultii]MBX4336206.1 preprotein translocase subunit SecG [Bartonella raoultii]
MQTVLIVIHFLIVITLVGVILIQPSEGGGLGASSSGSGLMRARGAKNPLTRLTAILACCFFAISIGLTVVENISNSSSDILKRIPIHSKQDATNEDAPESVLPSNSDSQPSILEQLKGSSPAVENPVPPALENPVPDNDTK